MWHVNFEAPRRPQGAGQHGLPQDEAPCLGRSVHMRWRCSSHAVSQAKLFFWSPPLLSIRSIPTKAFFKLTPISHSLYLSLSLSVGGRRTVEVQKRDTSSNVPTFHHCQTGDRRLVSHTVRFARCVPRRSVPGVQANRPSLFEAAAVVFCLPPRCVPLDVMQRSRQAERGTGGLRCVRQPGRRPGLLPVIRDMVLCC